MKPERRCQAHNRRGTQCELPAMLGQKTCRMHGGKSPRALKAAKQKLAAAEARKAVSTYGLPREVEPHVALIEELHRTAGHVAWLGMVVGELGTEDGKGELVVKTMFGEQPTIWLKLYKDERRHFAEVAKTCIAAGIEERRVKIAEEQGRLLANVIQGILSDLGVADRPEVPKVVRRHLTAVA